MTNWWLQSRATAPIYQRLFWSPISLSRVAIATRTHGALLYGTLAALGVIALLLAPVGVREASTFPNISLYIVQHAWAAMVIFCTLAAFTTLVVALGALCVALFDMRTIAARYSMLDRARIRVCALAMIPAFTVAGVVAFCRAVTSARWDSVAFSNTVTKPGWLNAQVFDIVGSNATLVLAFFVIAAIAAHAWYRVSQLVAPTGAQCPSCGYDIDGLDGCPECGVQRKQAA